MTTEEKNTLLGTSQVVWALADLYPAPQSESFRQDMFRCRELAENLAAEMRGRVSALDAGELCQLVQRLEEIDTLLGRLGTFAFLNFITRTADAAASALLQQIEELESAVGKLTLFFRLEWNTLAREKAEQLMAQEELSAYRHYLASMRRFAPHQLSAKEEELLQDLRPVGRSAWNLLFEKVLGQLRFGARGRTEEEVLSELYSPDRAVRENAANELTAGLQGHLHILTHIFNTLAAEKMIDDRLRRYSAWDSAMHLANELEACTVDTLVAEVTGRYDIVHRYYRVKKSLLGVDSLSDYDRYAPVPGGAGSGYRLAGVSTDRFGRLWRIFAGNGKHCRPVFQQGLDPCTDSSRQTRRRLCPSLRARGASLHHGQLYREHA